MRRLGLLLVLATALAGCKIDVEVAFDLRPDGTGDINVVIETDSEFERIYGFTNRSFEDLVATRGAETGLAFEVIEQSDGNFYRAARTNLGEAELEAIATNLAPGLGVVDFQLRETGVEVDASLNPLPDADDLAALFTVFDPSELQDEVNVDLVVRAPGRTEVSTSDRSDNGSYVWNIPMARQAKNVLLTTTLVPAQDQGSSFPWAVVIVILIVAVSSLFLFSVRSASREIEAAAAASASREPAPRRSRPEAEEQHPTKPEPEKEHQSDPEVVLAGEDLDD